MEVEKEEQKNKYIEALKGLNGLLADMDKKEWENLKVF